MDTVSWYRLATDAVLVLHAAIVCFVVLGPMLIIAGNLRGWQWVNARQFRVAHATAILVVIAESWVGLVCPLTTLEVWLRARAGGIVYDGGFIEHWLQRVLYYDLPAWVFTFAYSVFGLLVLMVWWRFPPTTRKVRRKI